MLAAARRILRLSLAVRLPAGRSRDASEFFSTLDRFQRDAFRRLRLRYPEPAMDSFCKAVALKAANAFAADFHFRNRHAMLVSRPVLLQVDPINACRLHCPGCLHSSNSAWASQFDWPPAALDVAAFEEFCGEFGPWAIGITLFRDGEPLLHRRFPEFVTLAKSHLLYTLASTSLSVRLDAESLVASGLDRLVAAIDGATSATYSRYRRGGDFELVIDNLRAIVRARKAQSSRKPWLVWQFLAFEHNVHEVDLAEKLARQIGIDQLVIARPYPVAQDDPGIRPATTAPFGETLFAEAPNWCAAAERAAVARNAGRIEALFGESWADRYDAINGREGPLQPVNSTCNWLYYNLTMDAARRISPCCLPPMGAPEPRHLVYANFTGRNTDEVVNSGDAALARRLCRSGSPVDLEAGTRVPYCLTCTENPRSSMPPDVATYLLSVDDRLALPAAVPGALAAAPLFARP